MRNCPNCGAGIKYDIASGQLSCDNCDSKFPVGSVPEARQASENGFSQAMIFSCPQCGGEILSTSDTAAGFCSYCGASVQLQGRMAEQSMPEKIVPFKVTKEQCAESFRKYAGKYLFSPGELRSGGAKREFRGIYMPYWDYTVHQKAHINRHYQDEHRSGDYRIVKHYDFEWDLDEDIENIQHDASQAFDDDIGVAIAPFEPEDSVSFDSGYMEGFYADVADTKAEDYARFALESAVEETERAIRTKTKGTRTDNGPRGNQEFGGMITKKGLSLFPVWFMSYRTGSRISYSVVNGQTGKVYMDLPVSLPKFFGLTAIFTLVLTVVLSVFLTPTPAVDVGIAMILSTTASILFTVLSSKVLIRDGLLEGKNTKPNGKPDMSEVTGTSSKPLQVIFSVIMGIVIICSSFFGVIIGSAIFETLFSIPLFPIVAIIAALVALIKYFKRSALFVKANGKGIFPAPVIALVSAVLGFVVLVLNPPSDFIYYMITTLSMVASAISLVSVILLRNLLSTRRLPEFDTHKGGDHRG